MPLLARYARSRHVTMPVRSRALFERVVDEHLAHGFGPDVPADDEADTLRAEDRPRTRAACAAGPRPCPWLGCRHHLWLAVEAHGTVTLRVPCDAGAASCALDLVALHPDGMTLEEVGNVLGVTRERVRQLEERALLALRGDVNEPGHPAGELHGWPVMGAEAAIEPAGYTSAMGEPEPASVPVDAPTDESTPSVEEPLPRARAPRSALGRAGVFKRCIKCARYLPARGVLPSGRCVVCAGLSPYRQRAVG